MAVIAFGLATLGGSFSAWPEEADQTALIKAIPGAKITLLQGIAQVAKGTEVPTEAKYEMEDGKARAVGLYLRQGLRYRRGG